MLSWSAVLPTAAGTSLKQSPLPDAGSSYGAAPERFIRGRKESKAVGTGSSDLEHVLGMDRELESSGQKRIG